MSSLFRPLNREYSVANDGPWEKGRNAEEAKAENLNLLQECAMQAYRPSWWARQVDFSAESENRSRSSGRAQ